MDNHSSLFNVRDIKLKNILIIVNHTKHTHTHHIHTYQVAKLCLRDDK